MNSHRPRILIHHSVRLGHRANDPPTTAFSRRIQMPGQAPRTHHRQLKYAGRLPNQTGHHRAGRPFIIDGIFLTQTTQAIQAQTVIIEEPFLKLIEAHRIGDISHIQRHAPVIEIEQIR